MAQHPENCQNPVEVVESFQTQMIVTLDNLEELPNFRLYQKEQIPSFGRAFSSVGSF